MTCDSAANVKNMLKQQNMKATSLKFENEELSLDFFIQNQNLRHEIYIIFVSKNVIFENMISGFL